VKQCVDPKDDRDAAKKEEDNWRDAKEWKMKLNEEASCIAWINGLTLKDGNCKKTTFVSFKVFNSPDYWLDWKYITITHQKHLSIWEQYSLVWSQPSDVWRRELCWQRVHGQQLQLVWLSLITKYIFKLVSYKIMVYSTLLHSSDSFLFCLHS